MLTKSEVVDVLHAWASGAMSTRSVHTWAEARYLVDEWEPENLVVNDVLGELDQLDMNLLTAADVPVLLEAIEVSSREEAQMLVESYFASIDFDSRRVELASDPVYAPFCRGAAG